MSNMNVLMNNTSAMFTDRQMGITNKNKVKSMEKLSSGYKINRAADDAAGLTISEKMRFYIRGLNQGVNNIQDGVSLCQVADGALNEVHDMLHRMNELAVKSANDTNSEEDREAIDAESRQIKEEISRIFETTSFNERMIFSLPYVPEATGTPDSFQMFNLELDGGAVKYGGIEINNIRHTFSEMGIDQYIDANGYIHIGEGDDENPDDDKITKDIKFTLKDGTGETVRLRLTDGEKLPNISRVYEWEADGNGIKVNGLQAATWSELGVTDSGKADGKITFTHKGITYKFNTGSDNKSSIIAGINGDGLNDDGIFTACPGAVRLGLAVNITDGISASTSRMTLTIPDSKKNLFDDDYRISADAEGVTLKATDRDGDSGSTTYTKIKWTDFMDSKGSSFVIGDSQKLGLANDDNSASTKTFDDSALYKYRDNTTGIIFSFNLTDEASLDAIINGLNNANISESYSAPGTMQFSNGTNTITDARGDKITLTTQSIGGNTLSNVQLQKQIGRNFDDAGSVTDFSISKNITKSDSPASRTLYSYIGDFTVTGSDVDNVGVQGTRTVYIKNDDDTYTRYTETTKYGTIGVRKRETYNCTQMFDVEYTAKLGGTDLKTNSSSNSLAVNYKETDQYDRTARYISGYEYADEEIVNTADLPDDAEVINEKKHLIGNEKRFENLYDYTEWSKSMSRTVTPYDAGTQAVSVSLDDGRYLFSLNATTHVDEAMFSSGRSSTFTPQFKAQGRASVSFTSNENSAGNVALSPEFSRFEAIVPVKKLNIQAGDDADNTIELRWSGMNLTTIGLSNTNMKTAENARSAIDEIRSANGKISTVRSRFGAYQNQLEHAMNQNKNTAENLTAAESRIRDTDMATESVKLAKESILEQAGQAMLTQANQQKQGILSLLQ